MATLKNTTVSTSNLVIPNGNQSSRPSNPQGGEIRYNDSNQSYEFYSDNWKSSPKEIVKDNLISHFDITSKYSWQGGPRTNIVRNTDLNVGWAKNYQEDINWNRKEPPSGINSQVVDHREDSDNGNGYWFSYGDYANQDENTWYTISMYYWTEYPDWSSLAYTADNNEAGRVSAERIDIPGDSKWHRAVWRPIYNTYGSESDSLSFNLAFFDGDRNRTRAYMCAPQMENNAYPTPFITENAGDGNAEGVVTGSVQSGGGVYDLSGNSYHARCIGKPGYSKQYGGSISFDGLTSYIQIDGLDFFVLPADSDWTMSCWVSFTDVPRSSYQGVVIGATSYRGAGWYWISDGTNVSIYAFIRETNGTLIIADQPVSLDQPYNLVLVNNGSQGIADAYINGELVESGNRRGGGYDDRASNAGDIGIAKPQIRGGGTSTYEPFIGTFYQSLIYNRNLSSAEVRQNYDALRTRFF